MRSVAADRRVGALLERQCVPLHDPNTLSAWRAENVVAVVAAVVVVAQAAVESSNVRPQKQTLVVVEAEAAVEAKEGGHGCDCVGDKPADCCY